MERSGYYRVSFDPRSIFPNAQKEGLKMRKAKDEAHSFFFSHYYAWDR